MVIGGTTQDDYDPVYFQLYEVTGLAQSQTAQIRRLAQPADTNNVSPAYGSDGRILFTSDRPRNGDRCLYPQLDEYETQPTVSGLWSMRADGSELVLLDHAPSGVFEPFVDSFGRVVFTRWDHLQRDQQADADIEDLIAGRTPGYGALTYEGEGVDAYHPLAPGDEVFPEARGSFGDPAWDDLQPTETGHTLNHFFPWMAHQDGTGLEILDHLGRHELAGYIAPARSYLDYDGVEDDVDLFLHIGEDPTQPGTYFGIRCPEFGTRAAGQVVSITAPPGANADTIAIAYRTHPATGTIVGDGQQPSANHIGMFRDPVRLADGTLLAAHTTNVRYEDETIANPPYPQPYTLSSRNDFAIRRLVPGANGYLAVGTRLMATPIVESISYFDNDRYRVVQYSGPLWELQPIELLSRPAPSAGSEPLPAIEQGVLAEELGDDGVEALREWLRQRELALITSRDVTVRADRQQDFELAISWSGHQTARPGSTPKALAWLQLFEGQQLRGFSHGDGRRVLARPIGSGVEPARARRAGRRRAARRRRLDGRLRPRAPRAHLADHRARRHPGRARALLAHLPARRDPRLHQLPRGQHHRRVRGPDPAERARGAARAGDLVARRGAGAGARRGALDGGGAGSAGRARAQEPLENLVEKALGGHS